MLVREKKESVYRWGTRWSKEKGGLMTESPRARVEKQVALARARDTLHLKVEARVSGKKI